MIHSAFDLQRGKITDTTPGTQDPSEINDLTHEDLQVSFEKKEEKNEQPAS